MCFEIFPWCSIVKVVVMSGKKELTFWKIQWKIFSSADKLSNFIRMNLSISFVRQKHVNPDEVIVMSDRIGMLVSSDTEKTACEDFVRWIYDCISFVWWNGTCLLKQWNLLCPITRWKMIVEWPKKDMNDYVMFSEINMEEKWY